MRSVRPVKAFLDYWRLFGFRSALRGSPGHILTPDGGRLLVAHPRQGIKNPVFVRDTGSDLEVFRQVFCERELSCVARLSNVRTIIDAGANTGLSATFLASAFPDATVIAVEPDAENFELLIRNTQPFKSRVHCLNAAIWSHHGRLQVNPLPYRDGSYSSKQFIPGTQDDSSQVIECVTIDDIMETYNLSQIDLLKIDIEGAEAEVFRTAGLWLPKTNAIIIELHEDSVLGPAKSLFERCVAADFDLSHSGEKVFAVRKVADS
jgi:FkbM family methyltransferase